MTLTSSTLFSPTHTDRPRIGLVCSASEPKEPNEAVQYFVNARYIRAVLNAGGLPLLIPLPFPIADVPLLSQLFDGIIIVGGNDVATDLYHGTPHESVSAPNHERDAIEIAVTRMAIAADLPLLGICRGEQVMNVAMGGTLYADIPSQYVTTLRHNQADSLPVEKLTHTVTVVPGTLLHQVVREASLWVNSWHHQAVRDLGNGFIATSFASDGLIESFENPEKRFVMGIQWHPECIQQEAPQREIFSAFISAAAEFARERRVV